jgi:hypothetical protein
VTHSIPQKSLLDTNYFYRKNPIFEDIYISGCAQKKSLRLAAVVHCTIYGSRSETPVLYQDKEFRYCNIAVKFTHYKMPKLLSISIYHYNLVKVY